MVSTASISSATDLRRFLTRALPDSRPRAQAAPNLPALRPPTLPALPAGRDGS